MSLEKYLYRKGIFPGKYGDYQDYIEEKEMIIMSSFKYKIKRYIKINKIFNFV
jgi:hypothetical protein